MADRFTPSDVIASVLQRIEEVNPLVNAIVTKDSEGARRAAEESTVRYKAGKSLTGLDGVPFTVKDNILVKGMRSTWGSQLFADNIPERDELPIARLRQAGGIILGKTNCPEFTLQGYTDNVLFGPTRNPWNLALTPGGSSGGAAAAVAAGFGPLAIGTDGGGSIRRPASHTGVIGLKPSRGRVPRCDGFPAILLDFEAIGPIARTVADVRLAMDIIAPFDPRDSASAQFRNYPFREDKKSCRILFVPEFGSAPVDPEIAVAVAKAASNLRALGHDVERGAAPFDLAHVEEAWPIVSQAGLAWLSSLSGRFFSDASSTMQEFAKEGSRFSAADYIGALSAIKRLECQLTLAFEAYDLILTPSAAALPWKAEEPFPVEIAGQPVAPRGHAVFTAFANLGGAAAINLPCGHSGSGLPIGFQLISRPGNDGLLIGIASQFEAANLGSITPADQISALNEALSFSA
jgi:aspartyl-tRNA(Asn)/glutamyl-tRNA(Gln) amidotransferase subunit A